jgi:hypothetical protein
MVNRMKAPSKQQRSLNPVIPLLGLGLAVWGTLAMMADANRPRPIDAAPAKWPGESTLPRPSKVPTLIMFVHPKCGWSKASVGELSTLMTSCHGQVNTYVLFLRPAGQATNWVQPDLWRQAAAIPGVSVAPDADGCEARLFRAATSGEVVLYGAQGRLEFQGGITFSRGHLGDNPGRSALEALIFHQPSQVTQTPVFGCPLFKDNLAANR